MKKILLFILLFGLISCSQKTYTFNGKKVTENKYIRLKNKAVHRYIQNRKPRLVKDSSNNYWIEYDSSIIKK